MKKDIIIGSHVNMSGSECLLGSVKQALSYNANTFMFYTGAPQNTIRKPVTELKVKEALELMQQTGIKVENLVVHAPYIINLANLKDEKIFKLAKDVLSDELKRSAYIGVKYIVLHPGAHLNYGINEGLNQIVKGLNEVLNQDNSNVKILLETMAGKGSELGKNFNELKYLLDHVDKKERLGVCLDTCHIFDAGYDIVNNLEEVLKEFDEVIGLDKLFVIHINDSKNTLGSHKDRHANIGKGNIGYETLAKIVWHPLLKDKIKILETPYIEDKAPYKEEIELLRKYND